MKAKICGIKDKITLKYLTSHPYAPQFIGLFVIIKNLKDLLN